jgi:hypothetical protein
MTNYIGPWLFVAVAVGIGLAIGEWLHADSAAGDRPGVGRAFLLGAAIVGLALHVPLAIDGQISHRSFAIVALAGAAAWFWNLYRFGRYGAGPALFSWIRDLPRVGQFMMAVVLIAMFVHCERSTLSGYDARSIYELKSRVIYDAGSVRGEDFSDPSRVNFNPGYPLLLPLLETQTYWPGDGAADHGLKLLFVAFAVSLAAVSAAEMRRFECRGFAALTALWLLLTPVLICCFEGAGLSGSADVPIAAFLFCGVMELGRWLEQRGTSAAIQAGIFLGAAVLTKSEGIILVGFCCAACAATMLVRRSKPSVRQLASLSLGVVLVLGAGVAGAAAHRWQPLFQYYPSYFAALDWTWLRQLGDRVVPVLRYLGEELFRLRFWKLLWPCVLGSLVLLRRGSIPDKVLFWRLAAVAMAAGYAAVFITTPLHLQYQLMTSATRLTLHYFPICAVIMAEQLAASGWSRQAMEIFTAPTSQDNIQAAEPRIAKAA